MGLQLHAEWPVLFALNSKAGVVTCALLNPKRGLIRRR